ncbi:MAG: hypothetical protein U0414_16730 [Polyangiaceae bacterium]
MASSARVWVWMMVGGVLAGCDGSGTTGGGGNSGTTASVTASSTGAGSCPGGVIVDGACTGKCTSDQCLQPPAGETWENTCVVNTCKLVCDSHADCTKGQQDCATATRDEGGAAVNVCQTNGKSEFFGADCKQGNECDGITVCPSGEPCGASNCGGDTAACVPDAEACRKQDAAGVFAIDPACKKGRCAAPGASYDGELCHVGDACPANECKPMRCTGAAPGDANGFCTRDHCSTDDDCPGGYACALVRDPHGICGTSPAKGDNNFCGTTAEPCIAPSAFATDGATYLEGSLCLLKKSCVKRSTCMPCATDLDCSLQPGQRCVQVGAIKACASDCATAKDCASDATCTNGYCVPKFGECKAPTPTFCAPCINDEDCGSKGSTWACASLSNGMRACFDEAFPDTCTTNTDCPTSPGGLHGSCLDENFGVAPGDTIYHHCYLPVDLDSNITSCW